MRSIATGLLISLGPALQSSRASTSEALQQNARGSIGSRTTRHLRDGLIVLQVAATLVLLIAAGLMLRTLANLRATELGFNPRQLLTMQVALPQPKYAEGARRADFYDRVIAGIRAQPGVEGAAFGSTLPFQSIGNTRVFAIEGRQQPTTLLVVFGGLALLIASIGLYGLLSQLVSARSREIGLRMALGATWPTLVTMVMSRGIVLTGVGMVLGAGTAWPSRARCRRSSSASVAADPITFGAVLGLLSAVALVACGVPAVRAARVDPMVVLRDH